MNNGKENERRRSTNPAEINRPIIRHPIELKHVALPDMIRIIPRDSFPVGQRHLRKKRLSFLMITYIAVISMSHHVNMIQDENLF